MRYLSLPFIALVVACGDRADPPDETAGAPDSAAASISRAIAFIKDSTGRDLGALALAQVTGGIRVSGVLEGLPPGELGIHLHTHGACTPSFEAAAGHWNPTGMEHGTANSKGPHRGDLPNLRVAADSTVTIEAVTPGGQLNGDEGLFDNDGAAVIVHAGPDDYRTDPAGGSGARIGCGVAVIAP